ncbi:hypothetical protein ABS771_08510 [Methylobacterium brachiatum]|uniref:Uncharacterized protein n=1 Tax=Methylobacterium brachiatum TaxID=269660 RepID=A0ABV1QVL4_9HYPH
MSMPLTLPDRRRLRSLRARARNRGFGVLTSRKAISPDNLGGVMITDLAHNAVIDGARFDLSLAEAEARVSEMVAELEAAASAMRGSR